MPRGIHRPPLRIAFSCCGLSRLGCFVFVLADEIIYWVKIAGQKQKHSDFFVCRWLLASFLSGFIYFGCRFWSSIMLAPCWCYRSGSVDSMFTQWGRCCDMTARQRDPLPPCALCVCVRVHVWVCVCGLSVFWQPFWALLLLYLSIQMLQAYVVGFGNIETCLINMETK